jgi:3-oxoacyl-[acyl-carrier-protein] synthase III
MNVMNEAYITGTGAFLPGDPVDNEQLAGRFGTDTPRAAALRRRTLAANGIKTRHYAVDDSGPACPTRSTCSARCSSSKDSACGRRPAGPAACRRAPACATNLLNFCVRKLRE